MKVEILDRANADLVSGYRFYEKQSPGLGDYFLECLYADIESLPFYVGTHRLICGFHRCLSHRFPYGIFYRIKDDTIQVYAVLDDRQRPQRTERRLKREQ